jgi:hypothetical protein
MARMLAPVALVVGVTVAALGLTAGAADARGCDLNRVVSVIGRTVAVTSAQNMSCADARRYVRRHTRRLPSSGRFFIGRFQCVATTDRRVPRRYRALCGHTASFLRITYYPLGSCGDVHVSSRAGGETGFLDIRTHGLSCGEGRRVVRRAGERDQSCPPYWRCGFTRSGRSVWTRGGRISFLGVG